jgi:hypothetical protein
MGGSSSKNTMDINTSVLNETITNFVSTNKTSQSQQAVLIQNLNLSNAKFLGCSIDIEQIGEIQATAIQEFSTDDTTDLQNEMIASIESELENQANQSSGWASMSIAEKKEMKTTVNEEITNVIKANVTKININEQIQNVSSQQNIESGEAVFNPCGFDPDKEPSPELLRECKVCEEETYNADGSFTRKGCEAYKCDISQNMIITLFAEQTTAVVNKAIQSNKILTDIKKDVMAKADQSTQGVGGAIGEAAKGIFGSLQTPFIISGVVLVIALIAFVLLKPKKIGRGGVEFGK